MSQTQYPKIVAIIEGSMERAFLNENFDYVHAIPIYNGAAWTTEAMARQAQTLAATVNYEYDLLVVWFDREKRDESVEQIGAVVRSKLHEIGVPEDRLSIVVCDRMTENLLLLDGALLQREGLSDEALPDSLGQNGKVVLKRLFGAQGRKYSETFDGKRMLKRLNLESCLDSFPMMADLKSKMPECWWG